MRVASLFVSAFLVQSPLQTSPSVQRDPQAVTILQQSIAAMGISVPTDSVALGSIVRVAGSATDTGSIRVLTRRLNQSLEESTFGNSIHSVVRVGDDAVDSDGGMIRVLPLELVLSSQTTCFPLVRLVAALSDSDTVIQYLALDTLPSGTAHHIRLSNNFRSRPSWRALSEFTTQDVWIDSSSFLPVQLFFETRAASTGVPRMAHSISYSNFQNVGGVIYPFQIQRKLNGTRWITIQMRQVQFNTGLTDADFSVQQ